VQKENDETMLKFDLPKKRLRSCLAASLFIFSICASAEEGGSGHYMPGSLASFMDGVSNEPTFIARLNFINYEGSNGTNRSIPIAGQIAANIDAKSNAVAFTAFWAPEWGLLNDKWNFGMSMTIPWVSIEVEADLIDYLPNAPVTIRRKDKENGLGDIILMPLMFNYHANADLNVNFRLSVYAPTGSYKEGRLANTGKNFWSFEPAAGFVYLGQKNGIEASAYLGVDFNTENDDTDYTSGKQAHLDATLAQHFPLWGGLASAGATGFIYRQLNGDSGKGATLGDFKARAYGIGPVLSYVSKADGKEILAELKWLHEFDNRNRVEGDTIFFKIMVKL